MIHSIIVTLATSLILAIIFAPIIIPFLKKLKYGQTIREDGPRNHYSKSGTPTIGGIIIIIPLLIATLVFNEFKIELIIILISTIGFGLIGFIDDYIKIALKRSLGLKAKQKLLGQIIIAITVSYLAINYYESGSASILVPFSSNNLYLGSYYIPFSSFVILGTVNSVNLTDGLDGLLGGISILVFIAYLVIAISLGINNIAIFIGGLIGSLFGFLIFNKYPAKVFMGDTGSFAIGGAISGLAVLTNTHLFLPILGFIFVIVTLSVIIQVISFNFFGKRVFRMSPLHHHFELLGWHETRVVFFFWLLTFIFILIGLYSYKLF